MPGLRAGRGEARPRGVPGTASIAALQPRARRLVRDTARFGGRLRRATLPEGKSYTTAELKINVVRPLADRVPLVRASGAVIHLGSRMATAEGRMTGPDGKLYAHASTTCFIFDTP